MPFVYRYVVIIKAHATWICKLTLALPCLRWFTKQVAPCNLPLSRLENTVAKTKVANKIEAEFHTAVKAAVADTLDLFKDDKLVRRYIRRGQYGLLGDHIMVQEAGFPEIDCTDVLAEADCPDGMQQLLIDASFELKLFELNQEWMALRTTASRLPSLTWPVITVKKLKNKGKKRKE